MLNIITAINSPYIPPVPLIVDYLVVAGGGGGGAYTGAGGGGGERIE